MHRPGLLSISASILSSLVLRLFSIGTNSSGEGGPAESPPATPTAEHLWPPPDELGSGEGQIPFELYVTKVTLPPGAQVDHPYPHHGTFVLTVSEGAICYSHIGAPDQSQTTVVANVSNDDSAPAECGGARTDCEVGTDCVLAPGEVVYLPTGSWITQSDTSNHLYGNVGDEQAVVYVSGWGLPDKSTSCGGSCPRP
jgi:hypothetical protein